MSDDLISRKAVLEILYDISDRNYGSLFGHGINKACNVIEHAETAFDKEKVIEELEDYAALVEMGIPRIHPWGSVNFLKNIALRVMRR